MGILSKLPERLSELMKENNLTPLLLANKIGVNRNEITRYLSGAHLPSFTVFVKLIEEFNCSADFLLGLIDYPPNNVVFHPIPPFSQRFRELLSTYKMSQYALHQKSNFSYDNFNKWLKGITSPYIDNLIKLSQAFDCSVDYLIGHIS